MSYYLPLFLVFLTSLWTYHIFSYSFLIGILTLITCFALYQSFPKPGKVSFILLTILFIFQYKTTNITQLTKLDNNQETILQMRLREYPPVFIQLGNMKYWIPAAHWLEERKESIIISRFQNNLSEILDPNLYFFANHPRERNDYKEFEKFPYFYFPFFIVGIYMIIKSNSRLVWIFSFAPIVLLSIIGTQNPIGPFSLFPIIVTTISFGIYNLYQKYKTNRKLVIASIVFFTLVFLQTLAYD